MLRWLDRLWLCLIAIAFCIAVPIWVALWVERLGLLPLIAILLLAFIVRRSVPLPPVLPPRPQARVLVWASRDTRRTRV